MTINVWQKNFCLRQLPIGKKEEEKEITSDFGRDELAAMGGLDEPGLAGTAGAVSTYASNSTGVGYDCPVFRSSINNWISAAALTDSVDLYNSRRFCSKPVADATYRVEFVTLR